ncbi:RHS repeat-associated protein [Chryseobacterium sp. H1D6B]|uniref:DUF6443 domain-containing protein n=1 Tax=Chryseobacterium sp. H1D6B TaxID=2940588 RepID=UPI0015CD7617|nr:DUF6443 domain-containing protein [Chryseobacterium sp. H1D6B]MDH6251244.1 RHS repeat-associated protein [Chryseobacterium sp. H1D6B]
MKKIIIPVFMLASSASAYAQQTSTENYVYSKTYLSDPSLSNPRTAETVQYMDGLGRPKQIVNVKASPLGRDVVTQIEYDAFGRQTKDYLPVPQSGTLNGQIVPNPLGSASSVYGSEKIYAEKIVENSPLDRIQQQIQVGNDWSTKPVKFDYDANTAADYVKKYQTNTAWDAANNMMVTSVQLLQYFGPSQLYKNTVTDEDGNKTIEFKNGKGQTVLVRKVISAAENADTYYVYNEYDLLAYVIPPLASAPAVESDTVEKLYYQYRYDGRKRLVEKKLPGKGWEYMVYDKADRLVMTQDAVMKPSGKWIFTKYDKFSRIVYTGTTDIGAWFSRSQVQTSVDYYIGQGQPSVEGRNQTGFANSGMTVYYDNTVYPTAIDKVLTVNYYDTYPQGTPAVPAQVLGQNILPQDAQSSSISTKSLPTASYVKNIEDDNWTKNYTWYDTKGRAVGGHSINHLGGYTKTESELDFAGVPQKTNTYHLRRQGETGITVREHFVYDSQNRLLQHYHQVDSKPEELLAQNSYNELSQLKNKKVGNNLQSIDYDYNIRGWMTDINKNQMPLADLGGKLFSYKIKYTQKEGIENPDPAQFAGKNVKGKYNGNIAEVDWKTVETLGVNPSAAPKRYGYAYDNLNRLTAGYYQNPSNPYSKENTESLTYDLNGNITNLYRTSVVENLSTTATVIDNLGYIYGTGGNQITNINDTSSNPTGYEGGGTTISYDLNGSMKSMPDKNIKIITYNFLNLPSRIEYGNGILGIDYKYRADGTKLQKSSPKSECGIINCYTVTDVTDYLDGFQYLKSTISNNGGGSEEMLSLSAESARAMEIQAFSIEERNVVPPPVIKTLELQFFPTSEGFYDYIKDQYIYQYKDHLGNVRISFTKNDAGVLQITDTDDYYPFGMNHLKTGNAFFGQNTYKNYKYNGKELQETGMYDYGARFYMPDIGRFGTIDPRSQYTHEAYSYVWNNPIFFNDPTGMTGEAFAHCPTCPNTAEFKPYIDNPNEVYVYNPETNTATLKVTPIQEVTLTGKAKSSDSGPGSLALSALLVSQADSPAPGPADVVAVGMLIGAGVWWTYNQFTQPSYTTIADPGAGYRNLKTEDTAEDDTDVNGQNVPQDSTSVNRKGGGKNGQHANLKAKQSAGEKYEEAKSKLDSISRKPNKTKEDNKLKTQLEKQVKHWKAKAQETGENHSRNAKGNR